MSRTQPLGELLRDWRRRRRMSQLDLASDAGVSARHLSFVETGRARPSRELVLHLAEHLDVPLRARNSLLLAAGYAPAYDQTDLDAPEMRAVRTALGRLLAAHEPYPALVVDRVWNLVTANASALLFLDGVPQHLMEPTVNVLRVTLHPDGLARRITNLPELRRALLGRLHREVVLTGDDELARLHEELRSYGDDDSGGSLESRGEVFVPFRIQTDNGELSFFNTIATFGTALDITVAELAIEAFFPADEQTAMYLRRAQPDEGASPDQPTRTFGRGSPAASQSE
jgi:transcriptional regulator with XRE-family HTH domain